MIVFGGPVKERLLSHAANRRWEIEVAGISIGGIPVATDDRSKLLMSAARAKAKEDVGYSKNWKVAPAQYVTLDADQLVSMADLVEQWVTICFEAEGQVSEKIENGTVTTEAQIDAEFAALLDPQM